MRGINGMVIYLDNATTTLVYPEVLEMFGKTQQQFFANPDALYRLGNQAQQLINDAKKSIAQLLAIEPETIFFTSGATESNNLALQGIANAYQHRGKHIITTNIEHASVSQTLEFLAQNGFEITYLPVNEQGIVTSEQVLDAITDQTILISIMHINNEIGSIMPIAEIAQAVKEKYSQIIIHSDMAQSVGKTSIDLQQLDLATFSGHKFHAPKGIGMLYKRKTLKIKPLLYGGQQQGQIRPGTQNAPLVAAFAKAMRLALEQQEQHIEQIILLEQYIRMQLSNHPDIQVTLDGTTTSPYIIHFMIINSKTEIQTYVNALDQAGVCVSTRSACHSKEINLDNPIMTALGFIGAETRRGIRISMSGETTMEEVEQFLAILFSIMEQLKL